MFQQIADIKLLQIFIPHTFHETQTAKVFALKSLMRANKNEVHL